MQPRRSLRVLHVVSTGQRRGAEVFASDLIRALKQLGTEQHVAVLKRTPPVQVPFDVELTVVDSGGRWLPGSGIRIGTVRNLRRLMAEWRPNVVQAHGGDALKYALVASWGRGDRIVYRRIGFAFPWVQGIVRRFVYGWLMRRAARIVAVAEALRMETVQMFQVASTRVVAIPNGVDPGRFESLRDRDDTLGSLGIPPDATVLIWAGAFTGEKDPEAALRVAWTVLSERADAYLLFAGDGPLRGRVEAAADRLGLDGRVLFLGNRPDVPSLLAASDLLLLTSRSEGMPAAVIEAGMAGIPAAAYAVGGVREVIVDGVTGILSRPGEADALAAATLELVRDPVRRGAMGAAARRCYRTNFGVESLAVRYRSLYEELTRGREAVPT